MANTIWEAVDKFFYFVDENRDESFSSVEECIRLWVTEGAAWEHCVGDYRVYLASVASLFATWHDRRFNCESEDAYDCAIPWNITRAFPDSDEHSEIYHEFFFLLSRQSMHG